MSITEDESYKIFLSKLLSNAHINLYPSMRDCIDEAMDIAEDYFSAKYGKSHVSPYWDESEASTENKYILVFGDESVREKGEYARVTVIADYDTQLVSVYDKDDRRLDTIQRMIFGFYPL